MSSQGLTRFGSGHSYPARKLATSFCLLLLLTLYSTMEPGSMPVAQSRPVEASPAGASTLAPVLDIVPSEDGTALYISAGGVGELQGSVFVNLDVGPGHDKHSYAMTYSNTTSAYVATAAGLDPATGVYGSLSITTTLGLDSGLVDFQRAYLPASTIQTVSSVDGNLELSLVTTDTLPSQAYVAIAPSYAPPGPLPVGYRLVGSVYNIHASGALVVSDRPMSLRLYYNDAFLAGADPHTVRILTWNVTAQRWDEVESRLFYEQSYLSAPVSRFAPYALASTPAWRDEFEGVDGLSFPEGLDNITLGGTPASRALVLAGTPGTGVAISRPITPTAGAVWDRLTFAGSAAPPTTTLAVDLLSSDGTVLLADVPSGVSLAGIDPDQAAAVKLRARMSSNASAETPTLDWWQVTWQVPAHKVYLPAVRRGE